MHHTVTCASLPPPSLTVEGGSGVFGAGPFGVSGVWVRDGSEQEKLRCRTKLLQLVPTEGLGKALADPTMGAGEVVGGTAPRWLWQRHGAQGVLLERDEKEPLWLLQVKRSREAQ